MILSFPFFFWGASFVWGARRSSLIIGVGIITWLDHNFGVGLLLVVSQFLFLPPCLPLKVRHFIIDCLQFIFFFLLMWVVMLLSFGATWGGDLVIFWLSF
jgi:hypothetical protein